MPPALFTVCDRGASLAFSRELALAAIFNMAGCPLAAQRWWSGLQCVKAAVAINATESVLRKMQIVRVTQSLTIYVRLLS